MNPSTHRLAETLGSLQRMIDDEVGGLDALYRHRAALIGEALGDGMTQAELARITGLSRPRIQQLSKANHNGGDGFYGPEDAVWPEERG